MSGDLIIDNHVIKKDIKSILSLIKAELSTNKIGTIKFSPDGVMVTCPHHKGGHENKPSCSIYTGSDSKIYWGTCHCFTCNFKGSLAKFVGECFDRNEEFGKEWLKKNFTERIIDGGPELDLSAFESKKEIKKEYLDENILNKYQSWHPYMAERKLTKEVCERFQIKYDTKEKALVFPVRDLFGNLLFLTRRKVDQKQFYIDHNVEKTLYLLNEVVKEKYTYTFITEAQIDALNCWGYGYPCIATMGTPSKEQMSLLSKTDINILITMFDNDETGRRFTENLRKLVPDKIMMYNIDWKNINKKDINELTKEEFEYIIKENNLDFLRRNI